jgi:hypothetical protein
MPEGPTPVRCATHPEVETNLRCSKCLTPICPRCAIQTPVGLRCRACARLTRLPTFQVGRRDYLLGALAGLGAAAGLGFAWLFIKLVMPFAGILNLLLAAGAGYAVGQAVSLAARRRRSLGLKIMAGLGAALAFFIGNQLDLAVGPVFGISLFGLAALGLVIYLAVSQV